MEMWHYALVALVVLAALYFGFPLLRGMLGGGSRVPMEEGMCCDAEQGCPMNEPQGEEDEQ